MRDLSLKVSSYMGLVQAQSQRAIYIRYNRLI